MKELSELVTALYPKYGAPGSRDVDVTTRRKAIDESAAAIAEAFLALERRAEAAEAKLAELEKQEPYGYVNKSIFESSGSCGLSNDHEAYRQSATHIPLFTRPAPATNLVELVFPVDGLPDNAEESQEYRTGFAMGCACYAKRIVELNPSLVRNMRRQQRNENLAAGRPHGRHDACKQYR